MPYRVVSRCPSPDGRSLSRALRRLVPLVAGLALPAWAAAAQSETDVAAELRALRERVAELERRQAEPSPEAAAASAARAAAADNAVADVLADADRRSRHLTAGPFTAGYSDGRFVLRSDDGRFSLSPSLFLGLRYVANLRSDAKHQPPDGDGGDDDVQSGFELRRAKLTFDGNAFSPDVTYRFQWATSRSTGNLVLEEAWARYKFTDGPFQHFALRAGQFLNGWDHETAVSPRRMMAVERSLAHEILGSGAANTENFVQGLELAYDDGGSVRAFAAYTDGFNTRNTAFTDTGGGSAALGLVNPQWGVAGRVEYKLFGDWKDYSDLTARGVKSDLLVVGAGGDVEAARGVTAYLHGADVQWKSATLRGLSVYAAFYGVARDFRDAAAGTDPTPYDWGGTALVAYLLDDRGDWEAFARYSFVRLDARAPTGTGSLGAAARVTDDPSEITVGVNRYWHGHAAKLTADVVYLPHGSPLELNGAGILSQTNDAPQVVFRAQFQLLL